MFSIQPDGQNFSFISHNKECIQTNQFPKNSEEKTKKMALGDSISSDENGYISKESAPIVRSDVKVVF